MDISKIKKQIEESFNDPRNYYPGIDHLIKRPVMQIIRSPNADARLKSHIVLRSEEQAKIDAQNTLNDFLLYLETHPDLDEKTRETYLQTYRQIGSLL